MEYIGTVIAIIIISVLYIVCYERLNQRYIKLEAKYIALTEKKEPPKQEKREMTEEEKEKIEKAKKSFNNLMTYDYEIALKRGDSEGTK
jgi:23S rRNA pseudoU1915 N3-methylase RlmH